LAAVVLKKATQKRRRNVPASLCEEQGSYRTAIANCTAQPSTITSRNFATLNACDPKQGRSKNMDGKINPKSTGWMKEFQAAVRRRGKMLSLVDEQSGTNSSLLRQIKSLSNAPGWMLFYQTYGPLIERFALKSGLNAAESQDVVQNTMIQVSKAITDFTYDRARGSFKSWLFNNAKWRIVDILRARPKGTVDLQRSSQGAVGAPGPESWEPGVSVFERIWDDEWEDQLKRDALEEVRKKVSGVHFQIFCLYVLEGLPAAKVAEMVGVRVAQVHLIRTRVGRLVRRELAALRKQQN
jgi:RNA polymerase sigma-70 factor (ECF subfamily)